MLDMIQVLLPTFVAIISLTMFTKRTRYLCYTAVTLSIVAELVPTTIDSTALIACVFSLCALLFMEVLRAWNILNPFFSDLK